MFGGKIMHKQRYLIFLLALTVAVGTVFAQSDSGEKNKQKEKRTDKSELKEKQKEKTEYLFQSGEMPTQFFVGEGSYLGVYLEEVSPERAKELNLAEERGAIVMKVVEGSPADTSGLKMNDVIVSFNGRRVDSVREMQRMLGETPAGRDVSIEVIRGGGHQTISATLNKRADNFTLLRREGNLDEEVLRRNEEAMRRAEEAHRRAIEELNREQEGLGGQRGAPPREFGNYNFVGPGTVWYVNRARLGIAAESLSDQLGEYFGVKDGKGVLVTEVREDTPASKAGLKAGDVIVAVDGQKVGGVEELMGELAKKEEGPVTLTVFRNRSEQSVTVTLEKRQVEMPKPAIAPRARQVSGSI